MRCAIYTGEEPPAGFGTAGGLEIPYGVSLLMYVDQLPSAARGPAAPGVEAQVPSLLSPLVAPNSRPPQVV